MNLFVHGGGDFFVLLGEDVLVDDSLSHLLVDRRFVLSIVREKVGDCLLCLFHCVWVWSGLGWWMMLLWMMLKVIDKRVIV